MIRRLFTFSIQSNQLKPVGRWSKPKTKIQEDIKVLLANYDSCGDSVCGTPKTLQQDMQKILKNKEKNNIE